MPVILFGAWLLFNGRITAEVVLTGAALTAALCAGCRALFGWRLRDSWRRWRALPALTAYLGLLVWEVLLANLRVIRIILGPDPNGKTRHLLTRFADPTGTPAGKLLLADSVPLTPGTITVAAPDGQLCVHALNGDFAKGLDRSPFVRAIRRMEARYG